MINTGNETGTDFGSCQNDCVQDVTAQPMRTVSPFVVNQRDDGDEDTGVEALCTVVRGQEPAQRHNCPPQDNSILKSDAFCGQRSIALVAFVLLRIHGLVGQVELQKMEPNPEYDGR